MSNELNTQGESFAELFAQASKESLWKDRVVEGKIVALDDNFVTIDVGLKSEGRVARSEFISDEGQDEMKVGDTIKVYIDRYEDKGGEVVLSRAKALREAAWDSIEQMFKDGKTVMGTIVNRVKGGFMVALGNGANAFLPGSQVDIHPVKDITPLVGIKQPFAILKMDKIRENIVVSRREVLAGEGAEDRIKLMESLQEGQVIKGIVKNITNYGAFVDIGGIDGLLHNTDISWKRINHPSEVLTPGQEVSVKVVKFNKETRRISLGMKQLIADPWEGVDVEFAVGNKVKGKVTNVTDYGIFVEVKDGVEGLVYVSEVSWKKSVAPSAVAKPGEIIDVVVLDVDVAKRRMGLGMKQLQENPWTAIIRDFPIGHVFDATIAKVADFGLFVKVSNDIDGMVHINDISWEKVKAEDYANFKVGDTIKVKVLEIDQEKGRINLGMKQLTENPYGGEEVNVKKGEIVTCVVSEIKEDGIEVTLTNGTRGFIKKIDLARDRQDRRTDRFAVGEKVDAKITSIDKNGRKIWLSVKALEIDEEKQVMEEFGSSDSGASLGDILGVAIEKSKK
jgi:small subunit ribosomal protein S1